MAFWSKKSKQAKPRVGGYIGYWGLSDWWLSEFSEEERQYIDANFVSFGFGGDEAGFIRGQLTSGTIFDTSEASPCGMLAGMTTPGKDERDFSIAERCYGKAEAVGSPDILDLHFLFLDQIRWYYKRRNDHPDALDLAIRACEKQIAISRDAVAAFEKVEYMKEIPEHTGFKQLAIVREKQGRLDDALALSQRAMRDGWNGDWERRIIRLEKKLKP